MVNLIKKFFYLFLDTSGSFLGVFLIILGIWMKEGKPAPAFTSWVVITLGICALAIHLSHYLVARKHGSDYFRTTRER